MCKIILNNIDKKIMYSYFCSKYDSINLNTKGTVIHLVDTNYIETLLLNLSQLKEQERIVDKIESLFEKLDKAKN